MNEYTMTSFEVNTSQLVYNLLFIANFRHSIKTSCKHHMYMYLRCVLANEGSIHYLNVPIFKSGVKKGIFEKFTPKKWDL